MLEKLPIKTTKKLKDYKTILINFGIRTNSVKSAAIKALIQKEFGDDV